MLVNLVENVTLVNDEQSENALSPIVVTDVFNKSIVVSGHSRNALLSILFNVVGNVTLFNKRQYMNALSPIVVTDVFNKFIVIS